MMRSKNRGFIIVVLLLAGAFLYFRSQPERADSLVLIDTAAKSIDQLTREDFVVPHVKKYHTLPACYIKKNEARQRGWDAGKGNLCTVLPGRAIGGDIFFNREGNLPVAKQRKWFEADLNYKCGRRNADRLLYSNDGLVYVTYDHYKTFQEK